MPAGCRAKVGSELIDCIVRSKSRHSLALLVDLMGIDEHDAAMAAGRLAAAQPQPLLAMVRGDDKKQAARAIIALMEMVFYLSAKSPSAAEPARQQVAQACAQAVLDPNVELARAAMHCVEELPTLEGIASLEKRVLGPDAEVLALSVAARAVTNPSPQLVERVWSIATVSGEEWYGQQALNIASACEALTAWNVEATRERRAAARHAWNVLRPYRSQLADKCLLLALLLEKKPCND